MTVVDGDPAIAYYRYSGSSYTVLFVSSDDINGGSGSWASPETIEVSTTIVSSAAESLSLIDYNGRPGVSYYEYRYGAHYLSSFSWT